MAESKEKKGVAVRVPEWVLDEIEAQIRAHPRPRPARGDLLEAAWLKFRSQSEQKSSTQDDNSRGEGYYGSPSTAIGGSGSEVSAGVPTEVSMVGEMLTALISSGRKTEVDAILRLIRSMFEQENRGRKGEPLPKTGHVDFDRAAEAVVSDAEELRDSEPDIPAERRRRPKRTA